jgi:putative tryptophan/tyrosine transport system substrate-binding protein
MRRREFILALGGAAAAWPLAARAALASEASGQRGKSIMGAPDTRPEPGSSTRALASEASGQRGDSKAQQGAPVRRIGVLVPFAEDHPVGQARVAAFLQGLRQLGWTDGRNVRIDYRWSAGDADRIRKSATELIALGPDVVMAFTSAAVAPLRQATSSVPIVFAVVADPVGAGYVESLARPGGNMTGFAAQEYAVSGKSIELLKEIVPRLTRVAVLRDSAIAAGPGQFGALQAVAPSFGIELRPLDLQDPGGLEHGIAAFARGSNNGLIVTGSPSATLHRDLIITLAARHKLPAVYYERFFVTAGGLISYGPDYLEHCRRAAGYVDRILKGEKPADLPVQAPTKYELVVNLKTARAIGLDVPPTLLARADEVIE